MAKQPRTFESNLDYVTQKIEENPYKVLGLIGQQLVREIRPQIPRAEVKGGKFQKTVGAFARRIEKDIQIGFYNNEHPNHKDKADVWDETMVGYMTGTQRDVIKETVLKNADLIQKTIGQALDQIRKGK